MEKSVIYVAIKTDRNTYVAKELRKIPGISEAPNLYGVYDIIAKVETENLDRAKIVLKDMKKIEDIGDITPLMIVTDKDGPIGFTKDKNGNIVYCHPSL